MPEASITYAVTFEDGAVTYMARILGNDGAAITQATLSSIACGVYTTDGTEIATPSVVVASTVYDTLQTDDARWTVDSTGYNVAFTVPPTAFPSADTDYDIEFTFTPASGYAIQAKCRVHTLAWHGS